MTLILNIPQPLEELLRNAMGDNPDRATLEALAAEGYRSGKLSRYDVQRILGFDNRYDTEDFLGSRGLHLNYTMADLEADGRMIYGNSGSVPQ